MKEQNGKSERYAKRQKKIYAKQIKKTKKFEEAYEMAYQKGDADIFLQFIEESYGRSMFVNDAMCEVFNKTKYNQGSFYEFFIKVGIIELSSRYGQKFEEKLINKYFERKIDFLDIQQLIHINQKTEKESVNRELSENEIKSIREQQSEELCRLLDLFTDDDLDVGIHRTGGNVSGKEIKEKGLLLTGHSSSGVGGDGDVDLKNNISFYSNCPGQAICQICEGAHYKNYGKNENVDIVLVGIPKKQIKDTGKIRICYDSSTPLLDPKYIIGCVSVKFKTNTIDTLTVDTLTVNDLKKENNEKEENRIESENGPITLTSEWLTNFKRCSDIATKKPKYQVITEKFFKFINKLRGKEQNTEKSQENITNEEGVSYGE